MPNATPLTCLPTSLCSWNYRVLGAPEGEALLTFNFLSEQGEIAFGGETYQVRKHGPMSGRWTLDRSGDALAEAHKPSAFSRAFELRSGELLLEVRAESAFSRSCGIYHQGRRLGLIEPIHLFTRRATLACDPQVPMLLQIFGFWLAVLCWRRAANNSNS